MLKPPSSRYLVQAVPGGADTCPGLTPLRRRPGDFLSSLTCHPEREVTSDHLGCIYGLEASHRSPGEQIPQGWGCQEGSLGHRDWGPDLAFTPHPSAGSPAARCWVGSARGGPGPCCPSCGEARGDKHREWGSSHQVGFIQFKDTSDVSIGNRPPFTEITGAIEHMRVFGRGLYLAT